MLEEETSVNIKEQKPEVTEIKLKAPSVRDAEEKPAQAHSKVQGCAHYFGYLSKRSTKEKIPEECMICENIVQCMLKNVTG